MTRLSQAKQWVGLLLSLRRKFPGKGYVAFGRLGLSLIALSFAMWFPGLKETIFALIAEQVTAGNDGPQAGAALQFWASLITFVLGTAIIAFSFIGYLRFMAGERPGSANDGGISVNVQPDTCLSGLLQTVASHYGQTIDMGRLTDDVRGLILLEGPIVANDFEDFLVKLGNRVTPCNAFSWHIDDDVYRLFDTPSRPTETRPSVRNPPKA